MLAMSRSRSPVKKGKGEDILEDSLNNRTWKMNMGNNANDSDW
jgi:hypothetical protein